MIDVDELREVSEQAHRLAADGVAGMSDEDQCVVALEARRLRELADHLEVHALGALDESGYTYSEHGMLTAGWFSANAKVSTATGRTQVNLARVLTRHLHGTDQAWLGGTITGDHAAALVRAANPRIRTQIVDAEDTLIGLVEGRTFTHWQRAVAEAVAILDQDGPDPNDPSNTSASWSRLGAFAALRARFAGVDVETVEQIIEAKTDELFRQQSRDQKTSFEHPELTRAQLRGQAIIELLLQAHGIDLAATRGPKTAVTLVVRADQPVIGKAAAAQVDWTGDTQVMWSLSNLDGQQLLADRFGAVLCDCTVQKLYVDGHGNPLHLDRTVRLATPLQRKAVLIRDGSCGHPGCDRPVGWLDIHHLVAWTRGGATNIDNLVALCRRHHALADRKGWKLTWCDGWLLWTTPAGRTYWGQRHGRQRAGPAPPHTMAA